MLAFLSQEQPRALSAWLDSVGLALRSEVPHVQTQLTIPNGKRPDIAIRTGDTITLIESKLGSGPGETQVGDYLDFLGSQDGRRALVLLTQNPESVPLDHQASAKQDGVALISTRWQDMAEQIGDPGEDTLAGDQGGTREATTTRCQGLD